MTEQNVNQPRHRISLIGVGIFLVVLVVWMATPLVTAWVVTGGQAERGQAGDLYGSINALFSGLAFAGVILAILLQREELALQRMELTLTRKQLKLSVAAQEKSQEALHTTIHAQTFKVAMDIIEAPEVIEARRRVWNNLNGKRDDWANWRENDAEEAVKVSRTFETVGTLIRRGILPVEYIVETWSVPIVRQWSIMELYLRDLRIRRTDPFIGRDFEWLTAQAAKYLKAKGVERPELDLISPSES